MIKMLENDFSPGTLIGERLLFSAWLHHVVLSHNDRDIVIMGSDGRIMMIAYKIKDGMLIYQGFKLTSVWSPR